MQLLLARITCPLFFVVSFQYFFLISSDLHRVQSKDRVHHDNDALIIQQKVHETDQDDRFKLILQARFKSLQKIARQCPHQVCSDNNYINLTETYGRGNNHFIQLAHSLWIGSAIQRTLILPIEMRYTLEPFDLKFARSIFCFTFADEYISMWPINVVQISGAESFAFKDYLKRFQPLGYSETTVRSISQYFICVYSAFWSHPLASVLQPMILFVKESLRNNLCYTAVHKRSLEVI